MEAARPAGPGDLPRIVELVRAGIAEHAPVRGGSIWTRREARPEPLDTDLAAALEDPDRAIWVGTVDTTVMGVIVVQVEQLHDGNRLGVIPEIYVEPGARGIGLGEAMMDLAVEWCRSRSCVGIDSLALPGDRDTKNFFESFGFKARAILVHRPLDP